MTTDTGYTIRVLAGVCDEEEVCPMVGELPARPGVVQIVAVPVTDPATLAAYGAKIGPGEVLVEIDKSLVLAVRGA
jgi:hypothetical protein